MNHIDDDDDDGGGVGDGCTAIDGIVDVAFIKFQSFNHVSTLDLFKTSKLNFLEAGAESTYGTVIRISTQELDL